MNFFTSNKVLHVAPDDGATTTFNLSAGTTDKNSVSVDRKGFEEVSFIPIFGDNVDTGTFTMKLQHSDDNTTFTDCLDVDGNTCTQAFTAGASDTDYEMLGISAVGTKLKRYVRIAIDRGTANTVIADLIAILSTPHKMPITQATTAGQFIQAPTIKHVCS